jgi:hypothetical protein
MMREAFEKYFEKLNCLYNEIFSSKPIISYIETINKEMIVSEIDDEGYVEWKPILQEETINQEEIESVIGFKLCKQLLEYYSSYLFASISGTYEGVKLEFAEVGLTNNIINTIKVAYLFGQSMYPNSEVLALGMAERDGDDGYTLYFDNKKELLFCHEIDTNNTIIISDSIEKVIGAMEASL